jgi:undecaprenyl-diphosphatase
LTIFDSVIYGMIQGLSEFLPVSSSGHLALLPHLMKIQDPGVVFDLMMHFGTALAVILYFRSDLIGYAKTLSLNLVQLKTGNENEWFIRNFSFSTIVSVIFIVLFMPVAKLARDPWFIIINLSFFGVLLWIADLVNQKRSNHLDRPMNFQMQWLIAGMIGASQALAIFPGVSRSGITLTVALLFGMKRKEAGAYSFLLSLPIILAGILKELPHLKDSPNHPDTIILLTGVVTSFFVGWLTIHFFMRLISKIQLVYFSIYRVLLAVVVYFVVL